MTGATGGLLAVHAHPDDETLATGALLATWARTGRPVTVVTCTRGERGEVIGAPLAALEGDGPALAAHRETELAGALTALGAGAPTFLDSLDGAGSGARYEDSGMAWLSAGRAGSAERVPPGAFVGVPVERAAVVLARAVRAWRPEVVVTYEPGGGYGHPDHVHAHRVTQRAVRLAADEPDDRNPAYRVPTVLWSVQRATDLRRAHAALDGPAVLAALGSARATLTVPDPAQPLPSVAVADDDVDLAVPVLAVRAAVLDAMRAHRTQVQVVRAVDGQDALLGCYALSNAVLAAVLVQESYRYAPGSRPLDGPWTQG